MATIHNEANIGDIAKTVIMSGDPRRVKNIAEKFLKNPRLVNNVREAYAYTGTYKGKEVTVMAHGMGMPSIGIYAYELFKVYDVDRIIRLGTCGTFAEDINILDILLVDKSYTESNFSYEFGNEKVNIASSSQELDNKIEATALKNDVKVTRCNAFSTDCFDWYVEDLKSVLDRLPKELELKATEMESFALFYLAKKFNREAACLLIVADSHISKEALSSDQREESIDKMTLLALENI